MKENRKEVDELNQKSLDKYRQTLERLHKANLTTTQAKKMSNDELKEALQSNAKPESIKSLKRVINEITFTKERKKISVDLVMKDLDIKDTKIRAETRREYQRTSGNIYFAIVDELNKNYEYDDNKEVYLHAKKLLKPDSYKKVDLTQTERDILDEYETP